MKIETIHLKVSQLPILSIKENASIHNNALIIAKVVTIATIIKVAITIIIAKVDTTTIDIITITNKINIMLQ